MKTIQKSLTLLLVLILTVPLCACTSAAAIDQQAYAILAGIEYGTQSRYLVTIRLADVTAEASQNSPNILSIEADTLGIALTTLNTSFNQSINFGQLRYIFFSRDLAQSGDFMQLIQWMDISPAFSPAAGIIICEGSAMQTIQAIKPLLGERLSRGLTTLEMTMLKESYIPDTSLHRMASTMGSLYSTPLGIFCSLSQDTRQQGQGQGQEQSQGQQSQQQDQQQTRVGGEKEAQQSGSQESDRQSSPKPVISPAPEHSAPLPSQPSDALGVVWGNQYAGDLLHQGGNSVDLFGTAAFTRDRLGVILTGYESQLLSMATGEFESANLTFSTDEGNMDIHLSKLKHIEGPHLSQTDEPAILLSISLRGHLLSTQNPDMQALSRQISQMIEQDLYRVLQTLYQAGCDPLGIGGSQARRYLTIGEYESAFIPETLQNVPIGVSVSLMLSGSV